MSWRTDALLGFNATLCLLQMESTSKKKILREIATPIHVYFSSTSLKPEQQKNWTGL